MIDLIAASMTTPVGLAPLATAAAIRGHIPRARESDFINKHFKPKVISLVGEEYIARLRGELTNIAMSSANERMLCLAGPALAEIVEKGVAAPLLLALPAPRSELEEEEAQDFLHPKFLEQLAAQSGVVLDARRSRLYRQGGAGRSLRAERCVRDDCHRRSRKRRRRRCRHFLPSRPPHVAR